MLKKIRTLILFLIVSFFGKSQICYYQDIYKGGICVIGVSTSDGSGEIKLPVHVPLTSTIKKIFLVTYAQLGVQYLVDDFNFEIDGVSFQISKNNGINYFTSNLLGPPQYIGHRTNIKDVTNFFSFLNDSITINWPFFLPPANCPSCRYAAPVLIILYDDSSLSDVNVSLNINDRPNSQLISLDFQNMNPAILTSDIALGLHSDRLGGNSTDGYQFYINNINSGTCNESENSIFQGGVIGTFFYENGTNTGLLNDTSNDYFSGSDGVLNLNTYVTSSMNLLKMDVDYLQPTTTSHNYLIGINLAYETPCSSFPVTTSSDTTICQGQTVNLSATGGIAYEWLPATNLSCNSCPNPIFSGDSSQLYTVRIWSSDSCSVVRPIMVHVRPKPQFTAIDLTQTTCGGNTGSLVAQTNTNSHLFSLDGSPAQSSGTFNNLSLGNYFLQVIDTNGCISDTVVSITDTLTVSANFTANPLSGAAPLTVSLTNQSTNATGLEWFLNGASQGTNFNQFVADSSGNYTVQLIAYQNNTTCADTAYLTISAYDSLIVSIPNVFTPNVDGVNDQFGITTTLPLEISYNIINRWGNVLVQGELLTQKGGFTTIWNGTDATNGVYFYTIQFEYNGKKQLLSGFVSLE